ncbi:response regulator transcription factor [Paenibacillus monticola]|uniref:Response regulator n=1 Tax=Paenibacillus monticola TaxID=2666075 RepID=A0A7X2L2W8_9BACL|nr:response regulator [Paenibacillus monticola]MRN53766.1 response regulator [Paenibacillus monticola]
MYTAIIAEDSKPILRNIQALMQSTELPIRITATVSNGMEALEYIKAHPVDILLTDIRMPKLDGLALIEQCKLVNPKLKAVLISGYSDFEYTRKALNLQVFDYLLKPVERHQLAEVMQRLVAHLQEQQGSVKDLLEGIVEPQFLLSLEPQAKFAAGDKIMLILRRQLFTPWPGPDRWNGQVIQSCLSEVCAPHDCWVFPTLLPEQFLAVIGSPVLETYPSVYECMKRIYAELQLQGIEVSIAAEPQPVVNRMLGKVYEKLDKLMNEQLSVSSRLMDTAYTMPKGMLPGGEIERLTKHFTDMIEQRQKERCLLLLGQQLLNFNTANIRITELERFIWSLAETFSSLGYYQDSEDGLKLEDEVQRMLKSESYEAFVEAVLDWTERCFDWLNHQKKKSGEELFQQLDQYLQQHIYSQISITDVALKFHVSPSYISRIIKKYSHQTFVHYYMQLKIAEACRLIAAKPEMKVKELSEVLSFGDQHYFSKVFKEYTGCSPTEYKEGQTDRG